MNKCIHEWKCRIAWDNTSSIRIQHNGNAGRETMTDLHVRLKGTFINKRCIFIDFIRAKRKPLIKNVVFISIFKITFSQTK